MHCRSAIASSRERSRSARCLDRVTNGCSNRPAACVVRFRNHMRRKTLAVVLPLGIASLAAFSQTAAAKAMFREADFGGQPSFQLAGRPIGGSKAASATAAYLAGSRIAVVDDGAVVIDADSGQLIQTDNAGKQIAALSIGKNAGLLTYDPVGKRAYVVDRGGNRVAIVKVGDGKLEVASSVTTPAEPFGIALSPDRKTVMVT